MIETVISILNRELADLFGKFPGVKIYGLTQPMTRKQGTVTTVIPALVDAEGEGKWVGVDDTAPLIIYHKTLSPLSVVQRPNSGYGDSTESVNLYNIALIAFFDRSKIKLTADEVQRFIQVRIPERIKLENFKSIRLLFQGINMNGQQVYQTEYPGQLIKPQNSMLQISYQVEARFSKACFADCIA